MRHSVGLDPGYSELGLVLAPDGDEITPIAWATYACPKKGVPDLSRSVSLAGCVVNRLLAWIEEFEITKLDIAIETPIFNGNPKTLMIQVGLLQELQSGIFHMVAGELDECWVTLVNPATSKTLAGCGKSEKPVAQSPFAELPDITKATREALADAWAHALSTWGIGGKRIAYHQLQAAVVKHVHYGPDEPLQSYWDGVCRDIKDSEGMA